jgi:hypothetical protein
VETRGWLHAEEPGYKWFQFSAGNSYKDYIKEYGLYTSHANSKYSISHALNTNSDIPLSNFSLGFDLKYEKKQTCGQVSVSLVEQFNSPSNIDVLKFGSSKLEMTKEKINCGTK